MAATKKTISMMDSLRFRFAPANSVRSPPPCGEGLGVGVRRRITARPPPRPPSLRFGGGAPPPTGAGGGGGARGPPSRPPSWTAVKLDQGAPVQSADALPR